MRFSSLNYVFRLGIISCIFWLSVMMAPFNRAWAQLRYLAKNFGFLGFEEHAELLGPHPFMWKTPTPPGPNPDFLSKHFLSWSQVSDGNSY